MSFVTKDGFWIEGDDGEELVIPHPCHFHDKFTAEEYSKVVDDINSAAEQIEDILKNHGDIFITIPEISTNNYSNRNFKINFKEES